MDSIYKSLDPAAYAEAIIKGWSKRGNQSSIYNAFVTNAAGVGERIPLRRVVRSRAIANNPMPDVVRSDDAIIQNAQAKFLKLHALG